jgi:ketosteroid isomerase-like protein
VTTAAHFRDMLDAMATGWRARDYAAVAAHFADDVHYGDPTRYTLDGRAQLLDFFRADDDQPQDVRWHLTMFDEAAQVGAAEYSYDGTSRYHGVALIRVRDGLITHWREYQHTDPRAWQEFAGSTAFPEQV